MKTKECTTFSYIGVTTFCSTDCDKLHDKDEM